ncbi:MAG TPA: carbamoyltransferase C-terminal domain-containing protein, partial [Planctomycetota bacterium]|nr:carbamoyltransferase C-terminal domain-containing protein [Planctomycetota bacterium]
RETWVPAAPDDAGAALGAALYAQHAVHGRPRVGATRPATEPLAVEHGDDGARVASPEACAELLAAGSTLARMRSAGGESTLGERAALASPAVAGAARALVEVHSRDPAYRRPLLLLRAQDVDAALELHAGLRRAALERPTRARPTAAWRSRLAEACLPDGSLRVRLVDPEREGELAALLAALDERGAPPALMAVELAQRGEVPPRNALEARQRFERSSLDLLDLGGRLYAR